jgi:hypothetical protein
MRTGRPVFSWSGELGVHVVGLIYHARVPPSLPIPTRDEFEAAWRELAGNVRALGRKFGRDRRQIYRWADAYRLRGTPDIHPED